MTAVPPPVRFTAAGAPTSDMVGQVTYDGTRTTTLRWPSRVDVGEYVPELLNHQSAVGVYDQMMRKTHISALREAVRLAIEQFEWYVEPGKASEQTTARVAANLGLPVGRDGDQPEEGGINWGDLLEQVLNGAALGYGHAYFEMAASARTAGQFAGSLWLDRLEPRPQNTLTNYRVAKDGSLIAVEQQGFDDPRPVEIPADRLAAFVWRQRPGDWWGEPILRSCFESEFHRDLLARIATEGAEFGAIGVVMPRWIGEGEPSPAQRASAAEAAASYRGGGYVAPPPGYTFDVLTPGMSTDKIEPLIKHWEQKSSAAFMAWVTELGTTGQGNRALGDNFTELWFLGLKAAAGKIARTAGHQIVRRLVDWNEGPGAPAPVIAFDAGDSPEATLEELARAIEAGVITAGPEIDEAVRSRYSLPERPDDVETPQGKSYQYDLSFGIMTINERRAQIGLPPIAGGDRIPEPPQQGAPTATAAAADEQVGRRKPTKIERQAAVDFAAIDSEFTSALDSLVSRLQGARTQAGRRLADEAAKLAKAGDLEGLASLAAGAVGEEDITDAALSIAKFGRQVSTDEAAAQGVKVTGHGLSAAAEERVRTRAAASALQVGASLSNSASSRALTAVAQGADSVAVRELVAAHIAELSDASLTYSATGALTGGLGEGRSDGQRAAADAASTDGVYYGSSMLDANACGPCVEDDGREFTSLEDAEQVYPGGSHNVQCEGGDRCRCLVVQVFPDETGASV